MCLLEFDIFPCVFFTKEHKVYRYLCVKSDLIQQDRRTTMIRRASEKNDGNELCTCTGIAERLQFIYFIYICYFYKNPLMNFLSFISRCVKSMHAEFISNWLLVFFFNQLNNNKLTWTRKLKESCHHHWTTGINDLVCVYCQQYFNS